ncbi:hypothetical protein EON65_41100 [archaeon]|nr:MAG: hypothetical protein EON65_41100 [archaeon]
MSVSSILFVLASAFLLSAVAYPFQERFSKLKANVDCQANSNPTPLSWHVHITYMLTNDQQIKEVSALRDRAAEYFKPFLGEDSVCPGTEIEPSGRYGKFI